METRKEEFQKCSKPGRNPGLVFVIAYLVLALIASAQQIIKDRMKAERVEQIRQVQIPDWVEIRLIDVDGSSRRGEDLEDVQDIVIHYVGNPGTTAEQNRCYYCNPESSVSSHFLIGLDGEILQCLPLHEKSSATNWRNADTISIEVCHPDASGQFTEATYASLVRLTAWLLDACDLEQDHIIRHYDVTGKDCPRYFVANEQAWEQFKMDAAEADWL